MPKVSHRRSTRNALEPQRARRSTSMIQSMFGPFSVASATVDFQNMPIYEVEMILDQRKRDGRTEFFLKWKYFSEECNSWEPRRHLMCPKLLHDYFRKPRQIARTMVYY
ncbi:blast:Chromobox protein homolog 5 [Drosophila guanche]|uniref:Blast:Chromobox protein homolog 5 n=1 Tax=Drosophila guanche TaxID=7266 RepID=A0A3B0JZU5_DROGU|nr:blast:Chromobox protein homolog 5 [Drosophila guanche]